MAITTSPRAFSSPGLTSTDPWTFLCRRGAPALQASFWPSLDLLQLLPVFLAGDPRPGCSTAEGASQGRSRRGQSPPLPCCHPSVDAAPSRLLAFWAAGAHCWLVSSFYSTRTPKFFSTGLFSVHSLHSLYWCSGLPLPRDSILRLALWGSYRLTFQVFPGPFGWHPFLLLCQLQHSAWRHPKTCWGCTWSYCLSLIKTLSSTGHKTDLRDTVCHWSPPGLVCACRNAGPWGQTTFSSVLLLNCLALEGVRNVKFEEGQKCLVWWPAMLLRVGAPSIGDLRLRLQLGGRHNTKLLWITANFYQQ